MPGDSKKKRVDKVVIKASELQLFWSRFLSTKNVLSFQCFYKQDLSHIVYEVQDILKGAV